MEIGDAFYMKQALQLAETTNGQTEINPAVGCVIVKNGAVVGFGAHLKRGSEHAEVHALNMARDEAQGSTVYITLEPCSHYGKTPPCAERLVKEKVSRVVVAALDPNPQVAGRGMALLRKHGIEAVSGLMAEESTSLNEMYNKYITTRTPFVTLKTASTLDGRIATNTGDSRWITGENSRAIVHQLRHRHQAIMVGIETVLADNPRLTSRLPVPSLQPVRLVVDSSLRLPPDAAIMKDLSARVIVLAANVRDTAMEQRKQTLIQAGAEVEICGDGPSVDLSQAMKRLGEIEISSILLEGGGRLNGAMLKAGLIDKMVLFYAPKIIGGDQAPHNFTFSGTSLMAEAYQLERLSVEQVDSDICITGYPCYPE